MSSRTRQPATAATERDPDAVEFKSAAAADYARQVEELARRTPIEPIVKLSYGRDRGQRLHVYAPAEAHDLPILVFFHGGAWINGHLGWLRFMAPAVIGMGAIFVAGTYRLAPRCRWPAQYEDACAALDCVADNAHLFGGDARRIVVSGHSAGGHLSALVTLRRESPPVRACFPVSCSFNLQYGDVSLDSEEGRVYKYLFKTRDQDYEASPLNFVAGNRTPFHIEWGEHDLPRIVRSSGEFVAALEREGSTVTHCVHPGASHFDCHLALADPQAPWYARLKQATA